MRDEDMLPADAIDPPEPAVIPGPEGLHPNDTWPTASGITQAAATASCEGPILVSPIFDVCDPYTETSRADIIDSCILDIQVNRFLFIHMHHTLQKESITACRLLEGQHLIRSYNCPQKPNRLPFYMKNRTTK